MTGVPLKIEEQLQRLFAQLGIERAHLAGSGAQDYRGLVTAHPDTIATLSLVCPGNLDATMLAPLGSRLLMVHGDRGTGRGLFQERDHWPRKHGL